MNISKKMADPPSLPRFESGVTVDGSDLNSLAEAIERCLNGSFDTPSPGYRLQRDLMMSEIAGKNAAIHAYDKIIWIIRSGFVTIVFGAWALLLSGAARGDGGLLRNRGLVGLMALLTLGAAVSAWFIDRNYVYRKFKVIAALDLLMDFVLKRARSVGMPGDTLVRSQDEKLVMWLLSVSGDQPLLSEGEVAPHASSYQEGAELAKQVKDSLDNTALPEALHVGQAIYFGAFVVFLVLWLLSLIVL